MERQAYAYFAKIDELGGMVEAVKRNFPQREIADAAFRYQQEVDAGQRIVVGVNAHRTAEEEPIEILRIDPALERKQVERLRAVRAGRDAAAVERALALDPRDRYLDAEQMRAGLADGARGVPPSELTTRALDPVEPSTEATRVVGATEATDVAPGTRGQRAAREPRAARAPRAAPGPAVATGAAARVAADRTRAPARRGAGRRALGTLLVLLVLAAGAIAAILATTNSSNGVQLRKVVYDNVDRAVGEMQQLIDDNTR
jgi:hypothetical protein